MLGDDVAHLAQALQRHRLGGEHDALAVAGRAGRGEDLAHPVGDVLPGHLDQAQRRDLDHVALRLVGVERFAQRLQDFVAVAGPRHVDEVDDDDAADVAQAQLPHRLVGGLGVDFGDRLLEAAFAAAGEAAAVDVDHGQRLGVVDDQVAARGQVDPATERRLDLLVDLPFLEQRFLLLVELDALDQLRRGALEEVGDPFELLRGVDDRLLELAEEDVAQDPHRQVGLLEDEGRALGLLGAPLQHVVEALQVGDLAHEVGFFRPVGGGADDQPARALVGAVDHLAQPVALGVGEPPADPDAAALRRVDEVAAGDRDVHREPRSLALQRVLDYLDEDLLAGFDQLVDPASGTAAALRRLLAAGQDDLVDVQEAVALEADVDEGGLHSGQDVVDLALVDVADDRAPAAALYVELGDVALAAFLLWTRGRLRGSRRARRTPESFSSYVVQLSSE